MNNTMKGADEIRLTPQQELWAHLPEESKEIVSQVMGKLKMKNQEDIAHALLAWMKFRVVRPFKNPFMQVILLSLIELLEKAFEKKAFVTDNKNK